MTTQPSAYEEEEEDVPEGMDGNLAPIHSGNEGNL